MEGVRETKRKHPYVVGLKSGIEESLSKSMCEELVVSEE